MDKRLKEPISFLATVGPCSFFYPEFLGEENQAAWSYDAEKNTYFCNFGPNNSPGERPFPAEYYVAPNGIALTETQPEKVYTVTAMPYWVEVLEQDADRCKITKEAYGYLTSKDATLTDLVCVNYADTLMATGIAETWHTIQITFTEKTDHYKFVWLTFSEALPTDTCYLGYLCDDLESYSDGWKLPYPSEQWSKRPHSLHSIRPLKALMVAAIGDFPQTSSPYQNPWNYTHPYPWPFELVPKNTRVPRLEGWTTTKELEHLTSYNPETESWTFDGNILFLMARTKAVRDRITNCFSYGRYNLGVKLTVGTSRKTYQTHVPRVLLDTL